KEIDKELESFSLFLKEKELSSSFSSEKQKEIYQDYFEIEPFIDIPITSGTIPIYPSLIIYWNEKYSNVWARKELKEIKKWIKEKGTRNAKRTFEFIEKWLNRHQVEDKLTDSELEELKKSKESFQADYKVLEKRRQLFFDNMNNEEWLKQF
ncbi:MAG: hypothetical protein Q4C03_06860, partial [bacterium]|nr:hypothetical protein [bacterium]